MTECERLVDAGIIPANFLNEEIRNDYTVSPLIKKVWAIEIGMIQKLIEVCEKHQIRFWIGYGGLIGAIRHKGFIPWDDDVDIWVPREDYERMVALPQEEWGEPYFLQTTLNDVDYYHSHARLRNSNTTGILVSKHNRCNNGIYVDIMPLDGYETNSIIRTIRLKRLRIENILAHAYAFNINPNPLTRFAHWFLHLPFIPYNEKRVYKRVDRITKKVPYLQSDNVGANVYVPYPYSKNHFPKSDFADTLWMPFEHIKVPVPIGYDHILKTIYGDYMAFPPVDKRGTWHNFTFEPDIPYKEYLKNNDEKVF